MERQNVKDELSELIEKANEEGKTRLYEIKNQVTGYEHVIIVIKQYEYLIMIQRQKIIELLYEQVHLLNTPKKMANTSKFTLFKMNLYSLVRKYQRLQKSMSANYLKNKFNKK